MRKLLFTALLLICALSLWAEDLRISQVDTNSLLFRGIIDIYFSLPGAENAAEEDFSVSEKSIGELDILSFEHGPNLKEPISFILLIDNSGSMYDETFNGVRRIDQAKTALSSFLDQIERSGDRAAVYTFNSGYSETAPLGTDFSDIRRRLSLITQPDPDQAYTELYSALAETSSKFPKTAGRRAVIVLSDGEDFPVERGTDPGDIVRAYHETGITMDGISISDEKDPALESLCAESGGRLYDVRSTAEINSVYKSIREKIQNEYRIRIAAPPLMSSTGELSLKWNNKSDSRILMIPMLFGGPSGVAVAVLLVILLVAAAALAVLFIIPFDKPVKTAQIQGLDSNRKTIISGDATVIGASRDADFTVANGAGIDPEHATIVHDKKSDTYTLVSRKPVRVNNNKVKTRKLTPGDVIRIEGSTIIFDAPDSTLV